MVLSDGHAQSALGSPIHETTVGQLLRDAAARWPARTALIEADL